MQNTDFNSTPYMDDFDAQKNFMRILFQSGVSVQARELTQAQTILQAQIDSMGRHMFSDGAMVIPGGISANTNQDCVKLEFLAGFTILDVVNRDNLIIRSSVTGLEATVKKVIDVEGTDPITAIIDYTNTGSDGSKTFKAEAGITFHTIVDGVEQTIASARCLGVDKGVWATVAAGVYFIRGYMVVNSEQSVVVSKYTQTPTAQIGFNITENVVTEAEDESLLSNATGTINYKAPGAHRFNINLELVSVSGIGNTGDDFVELMRVNEGAIIKAVSTTEYSLIEDTLATRTHEESGDYVVEGFGIQMKDHLKEAGTNTGVYPLANGGDASKMVAAVKPGTAYVKGYRINTIATENVTMNRARNTQITNNSVMAASYGNYILVNGMHSMPPVDITKSFELYSQPVVAGQVAGDLVGHCRCRAARRENDTTLRMYIFDVIMEAGYSFSDVKGIRFNDSSHLFGGTLTSSSIFDASKNHLVFKLPHDAVKSLKTNGQDTSYSVTREYDITTNASGVATISCGANEVFSAVNAFEYLLAVRGSTNPGTIFDISGKVSLSGSPLGRSLTIDLGDSYPNTELKLIAPVVKMVAMEKTKTAVVKVETLVFDAETSKTLAKCDVSRINSIVDIDSGEVITELFTLDDGIKPSFYGPATITTATPRTGTLQITYSYFEHSVGDYFSVDSYSSVDYEDIPTFTLNGEILKLSDCLDFRPLKTPDNVFTDASVNGEIVSPDTNIRADVEYYLPRADILYVSSSGNFGVVEGISSLSPVVPDTPSNTMKLANIMVPAYTADVNSVIMNIVDNKRYTMRDIGKLEARISNLEYYTTLSMLESSTNAIQVIDPVTGNNRFKNGFIADDMEDFRLSDVYHPEWGASIDFDNGIMMPRFVENMVEHQDSGGTGYRRGDQVITLGYTTVESIKQPYATRYINVNPYAVFTWIGSLKLTMPTDFWKEVKYIDPVIVNETINTRGSARPGTTTSSWTEGLRRITSRTTVSFTESTSRTITEAVVNTEVIPFMRSVDIGFKAVGLRPFTQMFAFFEGQDVNGYVRPLTGDFGDAMVTDINGTLEGVFRVPSSDSMKFETGDNVLRLVDNSTGTYNTNDFTTEARAIHTSGGTLETKQQTITSIRRLGISVSTSATFLWRDSDPIAQSFKVDNRNGEFISKIDVFFATKSANIPVTMDVVLVETGLPTTTIIPFGSKTLMPSEVNVSDDASLPTSFVFDDLLYLEEGRSYAIVLRAETQEYNAYIAQMGEVVIGSQMTVAGQPHLGSFFTSQNRETWTPEQNRDLKFTIWRAEFEPEATVEFGCSAPARVPASAFNGIATTIDSSYVVVSLESHGLKTGDSVVLENCTGGNGIDAAALNKTHTVTSSTMDTFTVDTGVVATQTGTIGGYFDIYPNNPFCLLYTNVNQLVLDDTAVKWFYRMTNQDNRALSDWIPFTPNTNVGVDQEGVIRKSDDLMLKAVLSTSRTNLSPQIDISGIATAPISFRINNDVDNPVCAYVTQPIQFDTPSTSARFYITAKLPSDVVMRLQYKLITTADEDMSGVAWSTLDPISPLVNGNNTFYEYEYVLENVGTFIGFIAKVSFTSSQNVRLPEMDDFRAIALA